MNLAKALNLSSGDSVAFAGAGGKTSAMGALARELDPPVVLTTTTHLGAWQANLADIHLVVTKPEDIRPGLLNEKKIILITGPAGDDDRLRGLSGESLEKLQLLCEQSQVHLLIESDGAKQRLVKAPAQYEPVIPKNVDRVVVLAGLAALGMRMNDSVVHRPENFTQVTGLQENEIIQAEQLVALLGSEEGGLKGVPDNCMKVLFLNQADDLVLQSEGGWIAKKLLDRFNRVLVGSLENPGASGEIFSVFSQTAGVILAAGGSERLSTPKQLLDWQGKPFVHNVAQQALEAGLAPLIVVTGAYHDQVVQALAGLPVEIVYNPDWQQGQSTSMKAGLKSLPEGCGSVMFLLSDQPQISSELIRQLMDRYFQNRKSITAPMVNGQRGNPLLFDQSAFSALAEVNGDRGGRAVINRFDVDWLPWEDRRILLDVDRVGDYERLLKAYSISD
ncbi:MAG TPA: putative selenium-dependent hydroxylase accessory protein YqeC [Anaerolineaceae bacterium]|nr:putative selenium-dependent hydroxylase accessory protein YqeC [Anaerolineaceae bacterium]